MPDYRSVILSAKKKKKKKKKQNVFTAIFQGLIPWKGDSAGEIIRKLIFLISIITMCVAAVIVIDRYLFEPVREREQYKSDILQLMNREPTGEEVENMPELAINTEYAPLYSMNEDFVGFITIKNTNINYPVVQGNDNEEYLYMDFNGNSSKSGTIFADYENVFNSDGTMSANTILYGHNLRTENFFTEVVDYYYKSVDYLKDRAVIEFNTLYEKAKYKIFSVMLLNTRKEYGEVFNYPSMINFKSKAKFDKFASECLDRSKYFTGVDLKYGDELLTLSTCDFAAGLYDMRIVVVARKVREGESSTFTEEELSNFKVNPEPLLCDTLMELWGYYDWDGRYWDPAWIEGFKKDETFIDIEE